MSHSLDPQQPRVRKYPFVGMRISDHTILDTIEGRHNCRLCHRSRKFFCYNCYIPVGELADLLPQLELPLLVDIIKHKKEIDGKSTAVHAAVLAPEHVRIHTFPDIPDYRTEAGVVLIFPSAKAATVPQLFERNVQLQIGDNYGLPKGHHMGTMLRRRMDEVEIQGESTNHSRSSGAGSWTTCPSAGPSSLTARGTRAVEFTPTSGSEA